jgi:hypothetical protein
VTDEYPDPQPHCGPRHPRRALPASRRALTLTGALVLSVAAVAAVAPAASATPAPPEPPTAPPPPPTVTAPGLPLWAVLVMLGGTIALSAATTLITLALQSTATWCSPRRPTQLVAPRTMHPPLPPARPGTREHTSTATPPQGSGP